MTFISKRLLPYTRIINISRRSLAIAVQTQNKATTLIINVYAPATQKENRIFWRGFNRYTSSCKAKCKGKITLVIAGDLNTTTLKWHNPPKKDKFTSTLDPNLLAIMEKNNLMNHIQSPTYHTFTRHISTPTNKYTYEATLDHILILMSLLPTVKGAKVITWYSVASDHLPSKVTIFVGSTNNHQSIPHTPSSLPRLKITKKDAKVYLRATLAEIDL